ncbi:hypothetical protein [Streptomyces sp. NPDC058991]|uniref:hypothetical protein n=1 Tax=unclassified Streptomyces TaxID=2593676 RepID=UPI00368FDAA3
MIRNLRAGIQLAMAKRCTTVATTAISHSHSHSQGTATDESTGREHCDPSAGATRDWWQTPASAGPSTQWTMY